MLDGVGYFNGRPCFFCNIATENALHSLRLKDMASFQLAKCVIAGGYHLIFLEWSLMDSAHIFSKLVGFGMNIVIIYCELIDDGFY